MNMITKLKSKLPWFLRREKNCSHISLIRPVDPDLRGCEQCLETGDTWVHLRVCLICGHVGCCDNSKNKHATGHFRTTGHPLIQSGQPGEDWIWCYEDEIMLPGTFAQ